MSPAFMKGLNTAVYLPSLVVASKKSDSADLATDISLHPMISFHTLQAFWISCFGFGTLKHRGTMHELSFSSSCLGVISSAWRLRLLGSWSNSEKNPRLISKLQSFFWEIWTQDTDGEVIPQFTKHAWMVWLLCIDLAACLQLLSLCHSLCRVTVLSLLYFVLSLYNSKFFYYDQLSRVWEMGRR